MSPILRDYQREAITDLIMRWDAGATRVPQVLATGLGKTEIFTALGDAWIDRLAEAYGLGRRVLVLAHTDELIDQAARKARQRNPHLSVGIVKADLNEAYAQIVVSSRQTLQSEKRRAGIRNVGLIIVDEAHHAVRSNTYGKILEHFGAFDESPRVKVAGFTATLARGDKAKLSTVWGECTFRRDILFGIRHGYLLDVRGERVVVPDLDMRNIKKVAGDYTDSGIAEELERTFAPEKIADHYAKSARLPTGGLRQGIAFWPLVETAHHGAEAFEAAGVPSAVVHGGLPKEERRLILRRFAAGDVTVVHNCMVLTEGFDAPWADVVVIARPTQSAPLYQQMVGRVLRPDLTVESSLRERALILDVVGAGAQHDLRSLIDLSPERPLRRDAEHDEWSLLELDDLAIQDEERRQTAAVFDDPTYVPYVGETTTVAFDPLHREKVWAQTPDGTFYMSAGTEQYVFLAESMVGDPGTYDLVWCSKSGPHTWPRSAGVQGMVDPQRYAGLSLDEAIMFGEDVAVERGGYGTKTLTSRKSSWRREQPSEGQIRAARASGLVVPVKENADGTTDRVATSSTSAWTRGELSEKLDAVKAARRIDPLVRIVKGQ